MKLIIMNAYNFEVDIIYHDSILNEELITDEKEIEIIADQITLLIIDTGNFSISFEDIIPEKITIDKNGEIII